LTRHWFNRNGSDVANQQRCAIGFAANDNLFDIFDILNERLSSKKSLLVVMNDITAAGGRVVGLEGVEDLGERE